MHNVFTHRRPDAPSVAVVSTYPPERCGLATFSQSLVNALRTVDPSLATWVVGVSGEEIRHGSDVVATVPAGDAAVPAQQVRSAIARAAVVINQSDAVIVQHEYGIYPGPDGAAVLDLLDRVVVPTVTVLHTVLQRPTPHQQRVLEQVVARSSVVVVMTEVARARLRRRYRVGGADVRVIPHGSAAALAQDSIVSDPRPNLVTWGLLGPGKGVESVIDALPSLRDLEPTVRYVIAGQTHPKVRQRTGDAYRDMLAARAQAQGVGGMVEFNGRYLDRAQLVRLIHQADAVVLAYESTEQVTSGVLVDAVAGGRPVVATAFPHAVELLGRGAGLTVPHGDVGALAEALRAVLCDRDLGARLRAGARRVAPELSWKSVATRYRELLDELPRSRPDLAWPPTVESTPA